jgi:hypothetical protein
VLSLCVRSAVELEVQLPPEVLTRLGDLDEAQYTTFARDHHRSIAGWLLRGEVDGLRNLGDALAALPATTTRAGVGIGQTLPAFGTLAGTVASPGLGGTVGGLIGTVGKTAFDRRRSGPERIRIRVEEAIEKRLPRDANRALVLGAHAGAHTRGDETPRRGWGTRRGRGARPTIKCWLAPTRRDAAPAWQVSLAGASPRSCRR